MPDSQVKSQELISLALNPIWEGLAEQRWTGPDLVALQRRMGKFNFFEGCQRAMRIELIQQMRFLGALLEEPPISPHGWRQKEAMAKVRLIYPSGWVYKKQAKMYRVYREKTVSMTDPEARRFFPEKATSAEWFPHHWGGVYITPGAFAQRLEEIAESFARVQTGLLLAQISCALEQHRLVHGDYPESMEALAPDWIELIPHDPINGEPFHYRRVSKYQFKLYSVGWDQTDDGGDARRDWVWSAPALEGKKKGGTPPAQF